MMSLTETFAQWTGLETATLRSVSLLTFFALTLPSPGRVEEEINKISPHLTPKIQPLTMKNKSPAWKYLRDRFCRTKREPFLWRNWDNSSNDSFNSCSAIPQDGAKMAVQERRRGRVTGVALCAFLRSPPKGNRIYSTDKMLSQWSVFICSLRLLQKSALVWQLPAPRLHRSRTQNTQRIALFCQSSESETCSSLSIPF